MDQTSGMTISRATPLAWLKTSPRLPFISQPAVCTSGPPALYVAMLCLLAPQLAALLAPTNLFVTLITTSQ